MEDNTITLSTGKTIELHHIPAELKDVINRRHPMPSVPIVETKTATGEVMKTAIEDDPGYLAECKQVQATRDAAWQEAYCIAAFKKVQVPDEFDVETEWGDELRYLNPDWGPRPGKMGRKLDYIAFDLLANTADAALVSIKINKMMGIDTEAIDAVEDSFPSDVQDEAD